VDPDWAKFLDPNPCWFIVFMYLEYLIWSIKNDTLCNN
jgi:hypothetical protein